STEDVSDRAVAYGSLCVVTKPLQDSDTLERLLDTIRSEVAQRVKDVVLVAADPSKRDRLSESIASTECRVNPAASGQEALRLLAQRRVDCVVLDSSPPDMTVGDFLRRIHRNETETTLPVILYTEERESDGRAPQPRAPSRAVALREVCSPERLL